MCGKRSQPKPQAPEPQPQRTAAAPAPAPAPASSHNDPIPYTLNNDPKPQTQNNAPNPQSPKDRGYRRTSETRAGLAEGRDKAGRGTSRRPAVAGSQPDPSPAQPTPNTKTSKQKTKLLKTFGQNPGPKPYTISINSLNPKPSRARMSGLGFRAYQLLWSREHPSRQLKMKSNPDPAALCRFGGHQQSSESSAHNSTVISHKPYCSNHEGPCI